MMATGLGPRFLAEDGRRQALQLVSWPAIRAHSVTIDGWTVIVAE